MPRDDSKTTSVAGNDPTDSSQKTTLKRGDACLYCRKRRIRCSADKPSCQHCTKLGRECVYDTGKPVSRVKQLEDKVAELEDLLKLGAGHSHTSTSNGGPGHHRGGGNEATSIGRPPAPSTVPPSRPPTLTTTTGVPPTNSFTPQPAYANVGAAGSFLPNAFGMFDSVFPTQPLQSTTNRPLQEFVPSQPIFGSSGVDPHAVDMFDFTTLDPNFMSLINSLGATSTGITPAPASTTRQHETMAVDPMEHSGLTPLLDPTGGAGLGGSMPFSQPTTPFLSNNSQTPSSSGTQPISIQPTTPGAVTKVSYHAFVTEVDAASVPPRPDGQDWSSEGMRVGVTGEPRDTPGDARVKPEGTDRMEPGWRSWIKDLPVPPELQSENTSLMGGWFDPADLPKVARDHLLDLFFSGMRMFGQEFHIPRFFASLSLPAAKRPHPCLLYTMYLVACRISTSPPIRSLEAHFYKIATEQLEESLAASDRLFDAVRAATILAVYKYSLGKYHEGWMMGGRATRLAISCGLHAIPSSVWKPSQIPNDHRADLVGLMRQRSFVLPPAADPIALGERIWAFWSAYTVDRCGAISTQWPPSINDADVTTPFPRPLQDYELGLVTEADDVSLATIYEPPPNAKPLPHYAESTYMNLRMRALAILERSSKLMYLKSEPGWQDKLPDHNTVSPPLSSFNSPSDWAEDVISYEQYLACFGTSTTEKNNHPVQVDKANRGGKGWMRCARVRTPKAYAEIYGALKRIEGDLPPEWRTNWEVWDGNVQDWHFGSTARRELAVLHFILGCAWMFLFDVFSFNAPNDLAVAVARRLAFTIRATANDNLNSDLDVFIAMTWSFVVKVLIREVKRLHSIDEHKAAVPLENEIDVIVQALRNFGKRYSIASYQATRAEQFRQSTAEDTKFMENDDFEDLEAGTAV